MSGYLREGGRRGLDPAWRVLPTGGLAGLPLLATLLGAPLEAAVLLEVGAGHPAVRAPGRAGGGPAGAAAGPDRADRREPGRPRGPLRRRLLPAPAGRHRGRGAGPRGAGRRGLDHPAGRAGHRRGLDRYRPARYLLIQQQRLLPAIGREPLTASPGCSPPWTSCSLGFVPPTHEVLNQPPPLVGYDLYDADPALASALHREGPATETGAGPRRPGRLPGGDRLGRGGRHPPAGPAHPRPLRAAGSTRSSSTRPGTGCWARPCSTACTPPPGATRGRGRRWPGRPGSTSGPRSRPGTAAR